jgi:small subunit ribosomal protein S11
VAATTATKNAMAMGLKSVVIHVNGTGQGKDTAMRSIAACGIEVTELNDVTAIPHNGCRPPKKPR